MTENDSTPATGRSGDAEPTLAQLMAKLERIEAAQAEQITTARVPGERVRLATLAAKVKGNLCEESRRAWGTYLDLLVDGCDVVVDGETFAGYGDRWVDDIVHGDLVEALKFVQARAMVRIQERAKNRRDVGRVARTSEGEGAKRNAVGAWRHLFTAAVKNRHLHQDLNPAAELKRPAQNVNARWALERVELAQALRLIGSTGDDPELDLLLSETIVIAGARVEGLLNLTLEGIDLEESAILLDEKNNSKIWQPVPPSFCAKLHRFALSRGAMHPGDRVFVKRAIGRRAAKPIDDRRFDYIFNDRLQPAFAWADKTQVTAHTCRHSAVRLVERSFGKAVGQAFARHKPKNVTDIYAKASQREVAAAVCRLWGNETHPWETRAPRLRR